jgi:DNA-directed RNA polymerase specialized sigma24 family protein
MILYINAKLNVWAHWVAGGRKVVGLGYPSQVAFTRLTPSSNSLRSPIENEEAWEIERAVHRLDARLRDVVDRVYLRAGTAETHAKELCICRDTLYSRLHAAHVKIMEWMQVGDEVDEQKNRLTRSDTFDKKRIR